MTAAEWTPPAVLGDDNTTIGHLFELLERPAWMSQAACRGQTETMYPHDGRNRSALAICEGCPVRNECRAWALDHDETNGTWGGLSERQRRRILNDRRRGTGAGRRAWAPVRRP